MKTKTVVSTKRSICSLHPTRQITVKSKKWWWKRIFGTYNTIVQGEDDSQIATIEEINNFCDKNKLEFIDFTYDVSKYYKTEVMP